VPAAASRKAPAKARRGKSWRRRCFMACIMLLLLRGRGGASGSLLGVEGGNRRAWEDGGCSCGGSCLAGKQPRSTGSGTLRACAESSELENGERAKASSQTPAGAEVCSRNPERQPLRAARP
jgi:hypothetical protein